MRAAIWLVVLVSLAGCASPSEPATTREPAAPEAGPKHDPVRIDEHGTSSGELDKSWTWRMEEGATGYLVQITFGGTTQVGAAHGIVTAPKGESRSTHVTGLHSEFVTSGGMGGPVDWQGGEPREELLGEWRLVLDNGDDPAWSQLGYHGTWNVQVAVRYGDAKA